MKNSSTFMRMSAVRWWVLLLAAWSYSHLAAAQAATCTGLDPAGQPAASGLLAEYYRGYFADDQAFFADNQRPVALRRTEPEVNFATTGSFGDLTGFADGTAQDPDRFSLRLRGSLLIATPGTYTFYLTSDDAAYLWLDGAARALPATTASALIDNGGNHLALTRSATVTLSAGAHSVLLQYGEDCCDNTLVWEYEGPGVPRQVVPASVLCTSLGQGALAPQGIAYAPAALTTTTGTAISSELPTVQDGGAPVTSYALGNAAALPAGISVDASTGRITVGAGVGIGVYDVAVTVTNSAGSSTFRNVWRVVVAPGCGGQNPGGQPSTAGLYAEYFSGFFADDPAFFVGNTPGLVRTDAQLNFPEPDSWGVLQPTAGGTAQNPDQFSARYRGSLFLAAPGTYTFYLTSDDASYLWLDNAALASPAVISEALLNNGGIHPATTVSVTVTLSAGLHNVLVLYGDDTLGNTLTLEYESTALGIARQLVPASLFCSGTQPLLPPPTALQYTPSTLQTTTGTAITSAPPVVTSATPVVEYRLLPDLLVPAGITINPATGQVTVGASVAPGTYRLTVIARNSGGPATFAGVLRVQVLPPAPAGCGGLTAGGTASSAGLFTEYYSGYFADNINFFNSTPVSLRRTEPQLDFEDADSWGDLGGVATGAFRDPDGFSARFRGRLLAPVAGEYTLYLTSDDGSYLWLDGAALTPTLENALINNGGIHPETTVSVTVTLTAGLHDLQVVYGEESAFNVLRLEVESAAAGLTRQPIPAALLCSSSSNAPLPVVLTHFTAEPAAGGVQVRWATASEQNSARFVVERSADASTFRAVGEQPAAGTSSQPRTYALLDAQPLPGLSYYRLRQLDTDGTQHLSGVVAVRWKGEAPGLQARVFPNPALAGHSFRVRLQQPAAAPVQLQVLDVRGRVVHQEQLPAQAALEQEVQPRHLPAGVYVLRFTTATGTLTQRLVVQ